jgi:hypothetical protein
MAKYKNLVLGVFAVLAPIVAYLYQVDPLSLCKGNLPVVTTPVNPQQLDAGTQ